MLVPMCAPPVIRRLAAGLDLDGTPVESYVSEHRWVLHLYRYAGELVVNGRELPLEPGFASLIPPGSVYEHHHGGDALHLYAFLQLEQTPRVGSDLRVEIPAMQDLGQRFAGWWAATERALDYWVREPVHASALLWHLLWDLATPSAAEPPDLAHWHHPALWRALSYIEDHLPDPIIVTDVVGHAAVSARQLQRLFRQAMGTTVIGYIRARRVKRAVRLLSRSELPIKTIAANVGIPDLHAFNKTVREVSGWSPRAHRHGLDDHQMSG